MNINKFEGINQFHDGTVVSDYCNVVPLGTSAIDRAGELIKDTLDGTECPVLETFIDSHSNIYVVRTDGVFLCQVARRGRDLIVSSRKILDDVFTGATISFCESSTKPSQIYFCDGNRVFYWNTTKLDVQVSSEYADRVEPFKPTQLPLFAGTDALVADPLEWLNNQFAVTDGKTSERYAFWPDVNKDNWDMSKLISVSKVAWFDNRLVMVQRSKNTAWLTNVDPSQYIVPTIKNADGNYLPVAMFQFGAIDTPVNDLVPHYYSSTASSASLHDVVAFAGQLYFLNDTTIEVWSATGNVDNPIQHNSQNTMFYGGRSPVIVADTLYLICRDIIHNDFIAAVRQNGAFARISNPEIEKQLQPNAFCIKPLAVRDKSMIVVYKDNTYVDGFSMTSDGHWWRYWNGTRHGTFGCWTIANVDGHILGVTKHGFIYETDERSRTYADGRPILRYIRGGFTQFTSRKIFRELEIIADSGIYFNANSDRAKLYMKISSDRGMNFSPVRYRTLGKPGTNDKTLLWRNFGSGNSILVEFGTSDNVRLQLYGLRIEPN